MNVVLRPFFRAFLPSIAIIMMVSVLVTCAKSSRPTARPAGEAGQQPPKVVTEVPQEPFPSPKQAAQTPAGPMAEGNIPTRGFFPKGIHIQYTSAADLNRYEDRPHTILVVVYQLTNPNTFFSLAKTPDGLAKLMQAERYDQTVVGMDQFFVEPGEEKTLSLDRAENAQYVAIVAGYYGLQPGQVNRVFEIPVIVRKKGVYGFRKTVSCLGQLSIPLFMGPNSIQKVSVE